MTYLRHITVAGKKYDTSSRLNSTPPIGAPNATATPAAHAALNISRRFAGGCSLVRNSADGVDFAYDASPSLFSYLGKYLPVGLPESQKVIASGRLTRERTD